MNSQSSGQEASSSLAAHPRQMAELSLSDSGDVSGGNRVLDAIGAFRLGWDIGTYIDRRFIAPLWY